MAREQSTVARSAATHPRHAAHLGFGVGLAAAFISISSARAQSFDCARATTTVEHTICSDPDLGDLDIALASELKKAIASAPRRRGAILKQERHWIADRDRQCPDTTDRLSTCLAVAYRARLAQLQSESPTASCQKIADRYRQLAPQSAGKSPLSVLSSSPKSGITLATEIAAMSDPRTYLIDWAAKQEPPVAIDDQLAKELDSVLWGMGTIAMLEKLPGENFYSISSIQGTAHCYRSIYFAIQDGTTRESSAPPGFEGDHESCMVSRSYGRIDGSPVLFQEAYDATPNMSSSITVATWNRGQFTASCGVTFHFAPKFTHETVNAWGEVCKLAECEAWRRAAFDLAEAAQVSPQALLDRSMAKMSPAQANDFHDIVAQLDPNDVDSNANIGDPANSTDVLPLRLPYVHDGRVYMVSLGHFTIGWRYFADWSVKFEELEDGKLVQRAAFSIGMGKGRLEAVSVTP